MQNPFREEHPIFNGKFKLITEDNEFRMSHWVKGFGIADGTTGHEILKLETSFDLEKLEESGNILKVQFRVYANAAVRYEAEIDPFSGTFTYNGQTLSLENFSGTFKEENE